jgi:FlaA1/EpsC-like NDP-sugar epimerase
MASMLQHKRLAMSLALLAPLAAVAYWAAFLLRFSGHLGEQPTEVFRASLIWVVIVKIAAAVYMRLHLQWSRYATFHDLIVLAQTVSLATAGILALDAMILPELNIPRSVVLMDWGVFLLCLAAVRGLPRALRDRGWRFGRKHQPGVRALIVGVNDANEALLRAIRGHAELAYQPVGFVDDRPEHAGRRIAGVPVLGQLADLAAIAQSYAIEEVLITAGDLPGKLVRELVQQSSEAEFRVKVLPSYEQLLGERVEVQPRPVAIADLLRRPSVKLETAEVRAWLRDRVVMVTGSAGSIGSEICRQILKLAPAKIVLVDRSETGQFFLERELRELAGDVELAVVLADLTDERRVQSVFSQHRPQVVFHAAAYKHVPLMEAHVGEAVKNIVLATRGLADFADEFGVESFVMISTDKAVNPTSVMGSCKRLAEQYVQAKNAAANCRYATVRFGNVLDSAGSVVPIFREQIARGGPVTVTHPDMVRYFMMIPEAAQLVIQAGGMGRGGDIFVLDMGEPVRIIDLARDMIRLSGLRAGHDVEIRVTGMRPGEKLFEELYADEEHHRRTEHPKILASTVSPRNVLEVIRDIRRLETHVDDDNAAALAALREIVPPYESATVASSIASGRRAA